MVLIICKIMCCLWIDSKCSKVCRMVSIKRLNMTNILIYETQKSILISGILNLKKILFSSKMDRNMQQFGLSDYMSFRDTKSSFHLYWRILPQFWCNFPFALSLLPTDFLGTPSYIVFILTMSWGSLI